MPPKSAPMTQAAMRRMIKESVDTTIVVERERQAKVKNDSNRSGPVRGQNTAPAVRECTFAGFMKCNPTVFDKIKGAIELRRWFEKTKSVFGISECAEGKKITQARYRVSQWFTAPTDGKTILCERCFTHHVGPCIIKYHKCGKVGHKSSYQGHTRNRCPKKVKQEVGEFCARAYAIKDADPKGLNVVTSTFLLNNRYLSCLYLKTGNRSYNLEWSEIIMK
ncbi:hypothetical protein Tco_1043925 [Tanacetum coccineum]|uniref:Reverse transcriptase domain-containing protein n=1 Tax=Tanacetum coccineum TaxID=301880 RepID=A0ABQ5GP36_9ASTR